MQFSTILNILGAASAVSGLAVPRSIPGDAKNLDRRQACAEITLGYEYTFDCAETAKPGEGTVVVDDKPKPKPIGWDGGPVVEPVGWDKDPAGESTGWGEDPAGESTGWGTVPVVEPVAKPTGWDKEPVVVV